MSKQRNGRDRLADAIHQPAIVDPARRVEWLKLILSLAFLLSLLLSSKLWLSNRAYPLTPVSSLLPAIPSPFDYVLFVSLLVILAVIAVSTKPRKFIIAFLVIAGSLSLWDQSRLQPWYYQYMAMFVVLGFFSWKKGDREGQRICLNVCRFIVASLYLWSGLQKINANFLLVDFPWLMGPFLRLLPYGNPILFCCLGAMVPLVEISLGASLLTRKYRKPAIVLALAIHVLILSALILHQHNSVVWPWNVAMMGLVVILFGRTEEMTFKEIRAASQSRLYQVAIVLFGIMPAFSFINLWDSYLSFTLYSGNLTSATLYVTDSVKERLPELSQKYCVRKDDKIVLDLNGWSYAELNVPVYPEWRIYRHITKQICAYAEKPSGVVLTVYEKPGWLSGRRERKSFDCSDLMPPLPPQSASNTESLKPHPGNVP